jgi:hypothetical protein
MQTSCIAVGLLATALLAFAADNVDVPKGNANGSQVTDAEISLLRKNLRDMKKQIVAANLPLTGDEAAKFWPLYGSYTEETIKVNDQRFGLVKEYAANYNKLTDSAAADYIRRWIGIDEDAAKLRLQWIPKFEQTLGERKAAMFFQIDRRIGLMQELQLSSQLPLVQP